jgi:hypothetical protein
MVGRIVRILERETIEVRMVKLEVRNQRLAELWSYFERYGFNLAELSS